MTIRTRTVPPDRIRATTRIDESAPFRQLLNSVLSSKRDSALIAAVLGPRGAGKTALLERLVEVARSRRFSVVHVNLIEARELWKPDRFYAWLVRKLKDQWLGPAIPSSVRSRLDFLAMLGRALAERRQPVLLAVDHLDLLPEACAYDLISDLREIQDRGDTEAEWGLLRCVIAGCVSVDELRRTLNSPNLQFGLHVLPIPDPDEAEESTRRHLRHIGKSADDAALRFLAQQTRGERAFLLALENYLPGPQIEMGHAEAAATALLRNASQYRFFSQPVTLYLLDEEFREKADRILDGSPVALQDPVTDIDRYQLAGAWITAGKARAQPAFRNGLVEQLLRGVRAGSGGGSIDPDLLKVANLQRVAKAATEISGLLACQASAWRELSGFEGGIQVLLGNRRNAFALDGVSISPVVQPDPNGTERNGQCVATTARSGSRWVVDINWPNSDESIIVRVRPDKAFSPSVAAGEMLRLWSLYLQPLRNVCLKLALEGLGRHVLRTGLNAVPKRIFVSSTYADLVEHRRVVLEQVVRRDLFFRGMEFFGADPTSPPPAEKIAREVREADVYLGIFGVRYGHVDPSSGLSMTELEFNEAESSGKKMLLYVMQEKANVQASWFDADTEPKRKAFLSRVKKHLVYPFATVEELARQVYEDLGKL